MQCKYYVTLLFTYYPEHDHCSYVDCKELIYSLYGITVHIEDLRKLYIPYDILKEHYG